MAEKLSKQKGLIGVTLVVLLLLLSLIVLNVSHGGQTSPAARAGVLDLSGWNVQENTLLRLDGEWEFMPFSQEPKLVTVPHQWNDLEHADASGASYRIRILNAPLQEPLALKLGSTSMAYRIYINDELLIANYDAEIVENSPSGQAILPRSVVFRAPDWHFDLVVQVRSNGTSIGGFWFPVEMGSEDEVKRTEKIVIQKEAVLIGALLMMALYYLSFYYVFRKDPLYLIIAAGCALIMLRISVVGDRLLVQLFPEMPMAIVSFLALTADVWAPLPFLLLIHRLFPKESVRWPILVYAACAAVFSLASLFVPVQTLVGISNLMYIVVFGTIAAGAVTIIRAQLLQRPGAFSHLVGFFAIGVLGLHDMLHFQTIITTRYGELGSVGVTIFLVAQAFVLAQRYAQSFEETKKLSAELTVLNRQKDDFLESTSYELKTPLHGIIGIADSLREGAAGQLNERQRGQLELIAVGGRRLNHLIDDLLVYSRMKYGQVLPQPVQLNLEPMIQSILDVHRYLAGDRTLQFETTTPLDFAVRSDERMLSQILHNLVAYTSHIAREGKVTVSASSRQGGLVEVTVHTDSGEFNEELRQLTFASFEQIDHSLTTEYRGMKLGLPIARALVELNGGCLKLDAETGIGASFRFTIPAWTREPERDLGEDSVNPVITHGGLGADDMEQSIQAAAVKVEWTNTADTRARPASDLDDSKELVLVADDDRIYLQAIVNALELEGYQVLSTTDGGNALRMIETVGSRLSLVICDIAMPDMSGFQLCRRIRVQWTEVELPVLMLSADHRQETMLAAFDAGSNDFLNKPFDAAEFHARVQVLLEIKGAMNRVKNAELALLQAQIKPHFLYNTLNTISTFCVKDPAKARDLIGDLSTYLRRSFENAWEEGLVTVEVELELVEAYLNMEQARYGSRLTIEYRIDPAAVQHRIPQFTIQPLAENAVRHGVMKRSEGGVVTIEVSLVAEGACRVSVRDNGAGLTRKRLAEVFAAEQVSGEKRSGIGLRNINERLGKLYGTGLRYRLEDGTAVEFDIPQSGNIAATGGFR